MSYPSEFRRIVDSIINMRIRGAGRIARAAVKALTIASEYFKGDDPSKYIEYIKGAARVLYESRPTAVSLPNGLRYVLNKLMKDYESGLDNVAILKDKLDGYASEFINLSLNAVKRIGVLGSGRIEDGDTILTHCNSQAAISVIKHAFKEGKDIRVYVTETRPRYQGRITASTLAKEGINVTLIIDSAARFFMNEIDKVIVGADAIAANGALVNKIGTSQIALIAYEARTQFMVASESYKFSPDTLFGRLIKIEERSPYEVAPRNWIEKYGVKVRNPAFDVTPPRYIDLIITEVGIVSPEAFPILIHNYYGEFYSESNPWD